MKELQTEDKKLDTDSVNSLKDRVQVAGQLLLSHVSCITSY